MKKKIKCSNEELGGVEVIKDFLPPPHELVLKDDGVKVTLTLSKNTVSFFKKEAKKNKVPYQKMLRSLLDSYTQHFKKVS